MAFLANGRIERNLHNQFSIVHFAFIFLCTAPKISALLIFPPLNLWSGIGIKP
ncbi:MAG: hypothetical protein RL692_1305 [Planctomycetota bacterium]